MHLGGISMSKFTHLGVLTALAAVVVAGSVAAAPVTLRASHQVSCSTCRHLIPYRYRLRAQCCW